MFGFIILRWTVLWFNILFYVLSIIFHCMNLQIFFLLILQLINLTYYQIFAIMNKGTMDILVESQIVWDLPGTRWIMLKVILYQLGLEMTFA